jgi:predicted O-methyltransferase YrrM
MAIPARIKSLLLSVPGVWIALIPLKMFRIFKSILKPQVFLFTKSALLSREMYNYSYHNTDVSIHRLATLLSNIEEVSTDAVLQYCREVSSDGELQDIYRNARSREKMLRNLTDNELRVGRQLLYYCLARILKPRLVFEAGTAHGIGSLLILQALKLNEAEGYSGRLITVDLNPNAGKLLKHLPSGYGHLIDFRSGNSETVLADLAPGIDLFFHDTVNIASHETRHYELLREKLSASGVICTTWGAAGTLAGFSRRNGRRYFEFTNEAQGHWSSDTLGISLPARSGAPGIRGKEASSMQVRRAYERVIRLAV